MSDAEFIYEYYECLCNYTRAFEKQFELESENGNFADEKTWRQIKDEAAILKAKWLRNTAQRMNSDKNLASEIIELFFIEKLRGREIKNNLLYMEAASICV